MEARQLNLWDNVAAESGFQRLIELKFGEAAQCFSEAQDSPVQIDPAVMAGKRACGFWGELIGPWQGDLDLSRLTIDVLKQLLNSYQQYSFKWLNTFSVQLLEFIASLIQRFFDSISVANSGENCPEALYSMTLLLIELLNQEPGLVSHVPGCLTALIKAYPNDGRLYYLLAASHYKVGDKPAAKLRYVECLIKYPTAIPDNFNFPEEIESLVRFHGPGKAVVYGAIDGILPSPAIDSSLHFAEADHQRALDCYMIYREAELSYKQSDLKSSIKFRKELMILDKELCKYYLTAIRKRENRSN